jgi:arsenite methyltransferase
MDDPQKDEKIKGAVRQHYGEIARRFDEPVPAATETVGATPRGCPPASCCGPAETRAAQPAQASCCGPAPAAKPAQASCCGPAPAAEAPAGSEAARLYPTEDLAGLPDTVTDASLGCGNPLAIAELKPGEVVLDLGSGGGIDCFLAARKVGPAGRVIGLDMTPDMIKLARRNAKKLGMANVIFDYGEMEEIPLPDASVDAIISNCVINLSPDKDAVFGEAYRVLRPGGRLSVSDMVVDGDLPPAIRDNLDAWAGCLAGALDESDYLAKIRAAGFDQVEVLSRDYADIGDAELEDVQVMVVNAEGEAVTGQDAIGLLHESGLSARDLARKVASIKVRAYKPA